MEHQEQNSVQTKTKKGNGCGTVIGLILLRPLFLTLIGIVGAWVVGIFFEDLILRVFATIGVTGLKVWELGALFGFVGSFFRNAGGAKNITNNNLNIYDRFSSAFGRRQE